MTPHQVFAAGYHRNNDGNMAAYRFFLAPPERAHAMARALDVAYVTLCSENMRETSLDRYCVGSLVEQLQTGPAPFPAWLERTRPAEACCSIEFVEPNR